MWTGNSWRKRRRDAIKDIRQLFGFDTRTHVRNVTPSAASIYPSWISRKNTTKFKFVCFLGERLREISLLISLIIHTAQRCTINSNIIPSQNQIFTKKKCILFSRGDHEARKWSGQKRKSLSWLSCRRNRRIAITIQQTITPPVCKYSTALDCVMRTTRGTTREKCRAYDKTNNKKNKK